MGQLTLMTEFFTLANNDLSSNVPSELAGLKSMSNGFSLENNNFCGDLPDELSDLEDQVNAAGGVWKVSDGNYLGTTCDKVDEFLGDSAVADLGELRAASRTGQPP